MEPHCLVAHRPFRRWTSKEAIKCSVMWMKQGEDRETVEGRLAEGRLNICCESYTEAAQSGRTPAVGDGPCPRKAQWEPTEQRGGTGSAGRRNRMCEAQQSQQIPRLERLVAATRESCHQGVLIFFEPLILCAVARGLLIPFQNNVFKCIK